MHYSTATVSTRLSRRLQIFLPIIFCQPAPCNLRCWNFGHLDLGLGSKIASGIVAEPCVRDDVIPAKR
jgi:hypothetical protein